MQNTHIIETLHPLFIRQELNIAEEVQSKSQYTVKDQIIYEVLVNLQCTHSASSPSQRTVSSLIQTQI